MADGVPPARSSGRDCWSPASWRWLPTSSATREANLAKRSLTFGFGFLAQPAGFDIPFQCPAWQPSDSYGRALWVCLVNTLLVSGLSIITGNAARPAARAHAAVSDNWLARNTALWIIELVRNTPQLVQIVFWYVGVLQSATAGPPKLELPLGAYLNVRGLFLPWPILRRGRAAAGGVRRAACCTVPLARPGAWPPARTRGARLPLVLLAA